MAGSNINRVVITGNLTRDPELNVLSGSGTSVCSLRIACNGRRKNNESGQWEDVPNYFDVTVWGQQGENCKQYLSKGRPVAVDGRLRWREWTTTEGQKRQAVDIIADSVQFLGGRDDAGNGNGNGFSSSARAAGSDVPIDTGDFETAPVAGGAAEDDIPF
jgi:single-strand DNA-binding protein